MQAQMQAPGVPQGLAVAGPAGGPPPGGFNGFNVVGAGTGAMTHIQQTAATQAQAEMNAHNAAQLAEAEARQAAMHAAVAQAASRDADAARAIAARPVRPQQPQAQNMQVQGG